MGEPLIDAVSRSMRDMARKPFEDCARTLEQRDLDYIVAQVYDRMAAKLMEAETRLRAMQQRQTALELKLDRIIALFDAGKAVA